MIIRTLWKAIGRVAAALALAHTGASQATSIIDYDTMLYRFDHAFEGTLVNQVLVPSSSPLRELCGVEYEIVITRVTKGTLPVGVTLKFNATFRGLQDGRSYRFYVHDDPHHLGVERRLRSSLPQNDPTTEEQYVVGCRGKFISPLTLGGVLKTP